MTGNPGRQLTIDTHHHILPDFFWQATESVHAPMGELAPLQWSREASISFMDDAGTDAWTLDVWMFGWECRTGSSPMSADSTRLHRPYRQAEHF